ncbi:MAG TPA: SH3 domain-containing protein [Noviherbaspirillum sp.]|nr:SH3 domain-containing protein [Noviherbaspirillum sp.]
MKHVTALGLLMAAFCAVPAASQAQQMAFTSINVHLRAGPSRDYPVVAILPAGLTISVQGCLGDYRWCDVVAGPNRGWVYAGNIVYPYQGTNVPVLTYGPVIGIGIITFSLGTYWGEHYRGRPWYPQRHRWIDRPHPNYAPGGHPPRPNPGFRPDSRQHPSPGRRQDDHRPPSSRQGQERSRHPTQGQGPGGGHGR